jgi:hypothetical protein
MSARPNPKEYYEHLLSSMPMGAERSVLRVLASHIGLANSIIKPDLIDACEMLGSRFSDERQLRVTIVKLRKIGIPICASCGESGYFLAESLAEYQEFRGREYIKKIIDMRETVGAMDGSIKQMFPNEYQQYQQQKAERAGQPSLL